MRYAARIASGLLGTASLLLTGCGILPGADDHSTRPDHPGFHRGRLADYKPTELGSPDNIRPNGGFAILCEEGRLKRWQTQHPVLHTKIDTENTHFKDDACWLDIEINEKEAQGFHQDSILVMVNSVGKSIDASPIFTGSLDLQRVAIPEDHTLVILIQDGWQRPGTTIVSGHPAVRSPQTTETSAYKTLVG